MKNYSDNGCPPMEYIGLSSLKNYTKSYSTKLENARIKLQIDRDNIRLSDIAATLDFKRLIELLTPAKFAELFEIEITKEQAFVLAGLWKFYGAVGRVSEEDGFAATNKMLERYGEPSFSKMKFHNLVTSLAEIRCIELRDGYIYLVERLHRSDRDTY